MNSQPNSQNNNNTHNFGPVGPEMYHTNRDWYGKDDDGQVWNVDRGENHNAKHVEEHPLSSSFTQNTNSTSFMNETVLEARDFQNLEGFSFNSNLMDVFPKYNDLIKNQTNERMEAPDECIIQTALEINNINKMIKVSEAELNKLLYLKEFKKELLSRLLRSKLIEGSENRLDTSIPLSQWKTINTKTLGTQTPKWPKQSITLKVPTTVKEMIEKRANMTKEDLEKEKPISEDYEQYLILNNILTAPSSDVVLPEKRPRTSKRVLQERQHYLNRNSSGSFVGFANGFNSYSTDNYPYSSKTQNIYRTYPKNNYYRAKLAALTQTPKKSVLKQNKNNNNFRIGRSDLMKIQENTGLLHSKQQSTPILKFNSKVMEPNTCNRQLLICQYCGGAEALIVCGGCANRWYCSRACQVNAWDKHSETCGE